MLPGSIAVLLLTLICKSQLGISSRNLSSPFAFRSPIYATAFSAFASLVGIFPSVCAALSLIGVEAMRAGCCSDSNLGTGLYILLWPPSKPLLRRPCPKATESSYPRAGKSLLTGSPETNELAQNAGVWSGVSEPCEGFEEAEA